MVKWVAIDGETEMVTINILMNTLLTIVVNTLKVRCYVTQQLGASVAENRGSIFPSGASVEVLGAFL